MYLLLHSIRRKYCDVNAYAPIKLHGFVLILGTASASSIGLLALVHLA